MRVDALTIPGAHWFVWDAERCAEPIGLVWVDDERRQYEQLLNPGSVVDASIATVVKTARAIAIYPEKLTIIINPVEDLADSFVSRPEGIACFS